MSYTTKTPKFQTKFESSTTNAVTKTIQLAESIKTNSYYLIEMSPSNNQIINTNNNNNKTSLKNLYNKSNQIETKENFKQQEMLKEERYPQIQAYESKISEQDEQIRYLQDENRELKSLINYLKSNAECQYCKAKCLTRENENVSKPKLDLIENQNNTNQSRVFKQTNLKLRPITNVSIICECDLAEDSYELFLDNLLQQLISAIRLNDLIKLETNNANLKSINTNDSLVAAYNSNNNNNNKQAKANTNYTICKSCKKIKLIENKSTNQIESINLLNYNISTSNKIETNQSVTKFQNMLTKQKEQQLNILNELSKMLNEYKKYEFTKDNDIINSNGINKTKNSSSLISLTSSSFSRFNFSKVFHSLSSLEIKQIESITNTSSTNTTPTSSSTSSNQGLLFSTSNINNNKSTEDTLNLNSSDINNYDAVLNFVSSSSDSGSLIQSLDKTYSLEMKSNIKQVRSSKIPKLIKDHVFSYSAQETTNFSRLTRQTKIPIRIPKKKPQQEQQTITQAKKSNESKKSFNNINKTNKKPTTTTTTKPSNIKFKKVVTKRPVQKKDSTNNSQNKNKNSKVIRSETFDKICCADSRITSSSSKTIIKLDDSQNMIDEKTESITNNQNNKKSIVVEINENFVNKKPKRYCFPTHKSLSVYYNDRLNKKYNLKLSNNNNIDGYLPIKYLSDTDVSSLADRLSSYDKDLFYNVYHLDTLYNNIDYILFNSYASDSELVYSNCSKNFEDENKSNSNYKLFINDYFNHKYDDYDDDEDEDNEKEEAKSDTTESDEFILTTNEIKSDDYALSDSDTKLVEFSMNDFNFDLDKENIFKSYVLENSMDDEEEEEEIVEEDDDYCRRYNDDAEEDEDYVDKFNTDDCIDNYYLNDDLLFDDEILKISILNDLSNTLDMKQIKLELNTKSNQTYNKKLFLDYVNSPTYSLSSFTSDSNYSLPKSITDSLSMRSSPIPYQKKSNHNNTVSSKKAHKTKKSKSVTSSQELNLIDSKLAISMPILTASELLFPLLRKSNSIIPLLRSFYFDTNYKEIDKRKNGVLALCSTKTYNILPINNNNNDDENKLNNFNTDFYKLCSESYLNGSDFNFNSSASITSFNNFYQKKIVNECCNNTNTSTNNNITQHKSAKHSIDKLIQNSLTFPIKRIQCVNNE